MKKQNLANSFLTVVFTLFSLAWIYPIVMILLNSLKKESAISTNTVFEVPTADTFAGLDNYIDAVGSKGFVSAFLTSLLITVTSVAAILLFCSMCAWFITRVENKWTKAIYYLFVFSMVVPFQMLMFTLAGTSDKLKLNTPWNIWFIYLGFGAGLAVFMFSGFMKSIPLEVEEAAMIDGCGDLRYILTILMPICKPIITTLFVQSFITIWNAYLWPLIITASAPDMRTIMVGITKLNSWEDTNYQLVLAGVTISQIPSFILFVIMRRNMAKGGTEGSLVG